MAGKGRFYPLLEQRNTMQPQIASNRTAQNQSTVFYTNYVKVLSNDEVDQKSIN